MYVFSLVGTHPIEYDAFVTCYSDLTHVFQTNTFAPHFVSAHIITMNEHHDICTLQPKDSIVRLLRSISAPLESGQTGNFYKMLEIMQNHGNVHARSLAEKINAFIHGTVYVRNLFICCTDLLQTVFWWNRLLSGSIKNVYCILNRPCHLKCVVNFVLINVTV